MATILDLADHAAVHRDFSWDRVWSLFDGDARRMNIAHECIDRHRGPGEAICVQFADGRTERYTFDQLADRTAQFAHWLARRGVAKGDRVAIMVEPSLAFYVALFGAIKYGAIAVPLFTLFGPEGLALRIDDCKPSLLVAQGDTDRLQAQFPGVQVVAPDDAFWSDLAHESTTFTPDTATSDLCLFQYTSGTTRALPEAVKHTHRAIVTLMLAALYGQGLRPGDRYFCPSSPAWGHGLAHGTLSPLALGIRTGSFSGKFDAEKLFSALEVFEIDNFAAAPTVFRMLRNAGLRDRYRINLRKISYSGEPMDPSTMAWATEAFGTVPCSIYGTTEVGVLIVNYPGLPGYEVRPGTLGKPLPGLRIAIIDDAGRELPPDTTGEIALARKDGWFRVKDRGYVDADGYFHIEGRSDDVIISAGWTMSAIEIENTLLRHPDVFEAAVVGVPDPLRGLVAKAYIVARREGDAVAAAIQQFMKAELSAHEYPRRIEFVSELPKTPAGKVNRKALRERTSDR